MPPPVTGERVEALRESLELHGQAHLLAFIGELSPSQARSLVDQIEQLDLEPLDRWIETYVRQRPEIEIPSDLEPAPCYPSEPSDAGRYREIGEKLVNEGRIAAFTVAGGQGTRLGWNGPKGTFPATPVTGKPLFRIFAEKILANQRRFGVDIPWYIMTSPINDADTRAFFADNNFFGLSRRSIFMFPQGVMPSFDAATGKILLAGKDEIAMNPDGHGGSIRALAASGALEDMAARGIEHISYFQVDNPLVNIIDPLFIGLHAEAPDSSGEMSSKMLPKAYPEEKVGVFCTATTDAGERKVMVIEYSDLPEHLATERDAEGRLRFNAGSIAIHLIARRFLERLTEGGEFRLPWHRAEKKVPYVDPHSGRRVEPEKPNAVKLEAFVFDAIPLAESSIVLETTRTGEFAPIKNAEGVDSPATSHQIQSDHYGDWLEARGVRVARDDSGHVVGRIEVSPLTALGPEELQPDDLPAVIQAGDEVVL